MIYDEEQLREKEEETAMSGVWGEGVDIMAFASLININIRAVVLTLSHTINCVRKTASPSPTSSKMTVLCIASPPQRVSTRRSDSRVTREDVTHRSSRMTSGSREPRSHHHHHSQAPPSRRSRSRERRRSRHGVCQIGG